MSFVVFNPTSGPQSIKTHIAPRPDSLHDGVLGIIDNGKTNSDIVLNRIVEGLRVRYKLKDVVKIKKHSASHQLQKDASRELAGTCDFVLAGIGD
jgi:hypothetical protein